MHDFEVHEGMKLKLLQQATDEGLASGLNDWSMDEVIAAPRGKRWRTVPPDAPEPLADVRLPRLFHTT